MYNQWTAGHTADKMSGVADMGVSKETATIRNGVHQGNHPPACSPSARSRWMTAVTTPNTRSSISPLNRMGL